MKTTLPRSVPVVDAPRGARPASAPRSAVSLALVPVLLLALGLAALPAAAQSVPRPAVPGVTAATDDVVLWPEEQRAFFLDGPAWLLPPERAAEMRALPPAERAGAVAGFLDVDPLPGTAANELRQGIARRRELVLEEIGTFQDDRARLLFLHGRPLQRVVIDCGSVFRPLEVWSYREVGSRREEREIGEAALAGDARPEEAAGSPYLVLYQPLPDEPYKVWEPLDAKRALYTPDMEYLMDQFEELRRYIIGRRPDLQLCKDTRLVERATGVRSLTDYRLGRPRREDYLYWLQPPASLAAWAQQAVETPLPPPPPPLDVSGVDVYFPRRDGQRLVGQIQVTLPPDAGFERAPEEGSGEPQLRLLVSGRIEQGGQHYDDFRVRFRPPPPAAGGPVALVFERTLRPGITYLLRMSVEDEVSGARQRRTLAVQVPSEPRPQDMPTTSAGVLVASGEDVVPPRLAGDDSLILLPPPGETVLGLWRATVLVSGHRIEKVVFYVDGDRQLSANDRPFSAELRLAKFPVEQVIRAEGYDEKGELVASDEIVINRPRAGFRVRVMDPKEGAQVSGRVHVKADVSVPEEKRLERVTFQLNDDTVAVLSEPPWEADVTVPGDGELSYLTVFAELADGTRAEAVRVLNAGPGFSEEVEVNLVELYVAAQDDEGHLVKGLTADDFEVREEGEPQTIGKFELMSSLPLTLGIVLDTSGSMSDSLGEAQRAASGFLNRVLAPGDRAFAVAFADVPTLLMPPTDDVELVADSLTRVRADGATVLHDAVITGLSYFRDVEGQQALVLLSDGDDTASSFKFDDALEYARRSEAAIYAIGLDIPLSSISVRNKLGKLSRETGGRSFFISRAAELDQVYEEIEEELRSRYLLAYTPDPVPEPGSGFREVDVKVKKRGVRTRTQRGYYP